MRALQGSDSVPESVQLQEYDLITMSTTVPYRKIKDGLACQRFQPGRFAGLYRDLRN